MNVLVIGSGGREHALAWRLKRSASVVKVFAAPGNPGVAREAVCLDGSDYLAMAAAHGIDLTVVGPEAPLMDGVVDQFREAGRAIFGPCRAAAQLEGSKIFSKRFFDKYGIPTARFIAAYSLDEALKALDSFTAPVVLKADGLAAGKGVIIPQTMDEARLVVAQFMAGELVGDAGKKLVIEEFLVGEEVSFIALSDGVNLVPLLPAQDHKNIFDGDRGPNTGGMGAYVDERILTAAEIELVMKTVMRPAIDGMAAEGSPFVGFLYAGLMMTADGPKTLEFNVRMGDPETQPLLYRLRSDLGEVLHAGATGKLAGVKLDWSPEPSVAVVLAAGGYPGKVRTGDVISGIDAAEATGATVFQAGVKRAGDSLVTSGGRVVAVTASGATLPGAIDAAYRAAAHVKFDGMQYRSDIGKKGLRRW